MIGWSIKSRWWRMIIIIIWLTTISATCSIRWWRRWIIIIMMMTIMCWRTISRWNRSRIKWTTWWTIVITTIGGISWGMMAIMIIGMGWTSARRTFFLFIRIKIQMILPIISACWSIFMIIPISGTIIMSITISTTITVTWTLHITEHSYIYINNDNQLVVHICG